MLYLQGIILRNSNLAASKTVGHISIADSQTYLSQLLSHMSIASRPCNRSHYYDLEQSVLSNTRHHLLDIWSALVNFHIKRLKCSEILASAHFIPRAQDWADLWPTAVILTTRAWVE